MDSEVRDDLEFKPLYRLSNPFEATFIKEVFDEENIVAVYQNLRVEPFPTDVGQQAEIVILVDKKDYDRATRLIMSAIDKEAITTEGVFASTID